MKQDREQTYKSVIQGASDFIHPRLNVLNVVSTTGNPINDSRIGSLPFFNQPLVDELGYCFGYNSGFELYPLMQQPPLEDPFESIASTRIVGEIRENLIASLSLVSGRIASHYFLDIVYAFTVHLKSLTVLLVFNSQSGRFCPRAPRCPKLQPAFQGLPTRANLA